MGGQLRVPQGPQKKMGRKRQGSLLYLRTGCVLNSEAALISPRPLPLRAASRTVYVVSGFRPMMVTIPSRLAVVRTWKGSQMIKSLSAKWCSCCGKHDGGSSKN